MKSGSSFRTAVMLRRYQSTVSRRPASRAVRARNPNSLSARLTSRQRLGCPLGLFDPTRCGHRTTQCSDLCMPAPGSRSPGRCRYSPARNRCSVRSPAPPPQRRLPRRETPAWATIAPQCDRRLAPVACLHALRIRAGITCDEFSSKLSRGPYRFTGSRNMAFIPYCSR